ncbi:MAG: hypothetical protein BWK75_06880 [Candidatus Altiarchaeales archaeon A3]|nr:MAG: hypothetical protein BWK75_06880 [Candidatus Altiarchaeales archaeon A3]
MDINTIYKGTTTIGLKCKDGVVLVSDSRASMGSFIASKEARKIYPISEHVAGTVAGSVGDAEKFMELLNTEASFYRLQNGKELSTKGIMTLGTHILHGNRYYPYLVQILICGYNTESNKGEIYSIDPIGGVTEEDVASTGSGSLTAYGVLESEYSSEKTIDENLRLGIKSLGIAMERDSATGNHIKAAVITIDGYKEIPNDEVKKIYGEVKRK